MARKKVKKARKRKRKMVRIYFKPYRPPKWWPRDDKGKAEFVGVTTNGFGWMIGDGDKFDARHEKEIKENIMFDFGESARFKVEAIQ